MMSAMKLAVVAPGDGVSSSRAPRPSIGIRPCGVRLNVCRGSELAASTSARMHAYASAITSAPVVPITSTP